MYCNPFQIFCIPFIVLLDGGIIIGWIFGHVNFRVEIETYVEATLGNLVLLVEEDFVISLNGRFNILDLQVVAIGIFANLGKFGRNPCLHIAQTNCCGQIEAHTVDGSSLSGHLVGYVNG